MTTKQLLFALLQNLWSSVKKIERAQVTYIALAVLMFLVFSSWKTNTNLKHQVAELQSLTIAQIDSIEQLADENAKKQSEIKAQIESLEAFENRTDDLTRQLSGLRGQLETLKKQSIAQKSPTLSNTFSKVNLRGKSSKHARGVAWRERDEIYIQRYALIARQEQDKYGVPASITLAQGLHESNGGTSKLATNANQHFGIKWNKKVGGPIVQHIQGTQAAKDDDYKNGKLVNSRFIKFDRPWACFRYHSLFLQLPAYKKHCHPCGIDYKCWARGLKKAHYATYPLYDVKLIAIIEQYNLQQFDK